MNRNKNKTNCVSKNDPGEILMETSKRLIGVCLLMIFVSISSRAQTSSCTPAGNPSVFGNNVWNVYAWNAGGTYITTDAWNTNYSGYYVDDNLSFNTELGWDQYGSPSDAPGFTGCSVEPDNHSWSAKREGFT